MLPSRFSTIGQRHRGKSVNELLTIGGRIIGSVGLLMCGIAVAWRILGNYFLAGFGLGTLLQAGTSTVVIGCFLLLARVDRR